MMAVGNGWSWYLDSLVLARRVSIGTARKISQVYSHHDSLEAGLTFITDCRRAWACNGVVSVHFHRYHSFVVGQPMPYYTFV
jgi:hypothetical protein